MKIKFSKTHLAVLSCVLTSPMPVLAQSVQGSETVVTAARVEQPLADVLPSITLITRADIERSQAASLADLLQGEAGFEFGRNGGPGTTTSFFPRGAASTNLVVMIDGVRTMVDGWGNLTAIDLPLQQIERIELLRGNASGLYGEAAVGGVLQIFTRKLDGPSGAYASATVGSRNTQAVTAGYAGQQGDVAYRFDLGGNHTDGFSAMNPVQNARVNPDNDAVDRTYFSGKVAKRVSRDLTLGAYASLIRSDVAYDDGSSPAVATDRQLLRRESATLNIFAQGQLSADWNSRVDLSRTNLELRDFKNDLPKRSAFDSGLSMGQQTAVRWFNTYAAGRDRVLNFGLESGEEFYTADAISSGYRASRQMGGYFVGLNQSFGALSLQANVRQDSVRVSKTDTTYARTWDNTSGLLGLGYRLTDAWRLTGSVSTGFRAPSAGELSNNIDLKPETHLSQEAGVAYARGTDTLRAVVFDTRTTDAIYWQSVSPFTPVNIGKVRNQGLELSGSTQWQDTRVRYALVTQDPWNESDGTRLARRARQYGSLDVSRSFGLTTAGVKLNASDDRYDTGAPGKTLPGYVTVALYASQVLDKDWTLRVKVENALDTPYQLAYGYNTPGFGVFVTLAYQQH